MKLTQLKNIALMAASLAIASTASANLLGDNINIASFANQSGANVTVGAGVEYDFTHALGQRDMIDVTGSTFSVSIFPPVLNWLYSGAAGGDKVILAGLDWAGGTISNVQMTSPAVSNNVTAFNLQFSDGPAANDGWISFEMQGGNPQTASPASWQFAITAVPEPETYAMLLVGLGLVGSIARRRKDRNA